MICLCLTASTIEEDRAAFLANKEFVQLVELRVDRLKQDQFGLIVPFLASLRDDYQMKAILTLRLAEDGGSWAYGEDERRQLIHRTVDQLCAGGAKAAGLAYVDLEAGKDFGELETFVRSCACTIIRSRHNFAGTPADLLEQVEALYSTTISDASSQDPVIAKFACTCRGVADLLLLVKTTAQLRKHGRRFVVLGMGAFGVPSRILSSKLGSLWTYTSSQQVPGQAAAPGHMDPALLAQGFRFAQIGAATKVFGIIGNPVMHSRSPAFHNSRFDAEQVDAVYVPFMVDDLASFFQLASELAIAGLSVTIPHKEAVRAYLTVEDELVREIGACNTLVSRSKSWYGTNTDAPGFFAPLALLLESRPGIKRKALVLGAGGAARAIVQSLLSHGFSVLLVNRGLERAQVLVNDFLKWYPQMIEARGLDDLDYHDADFLDYCHVIVQTTSLGMQGPDSNKDALEHYQYRGHEIVYDIVYVPEQTVFLRRARQAACTVINGRPMFDEQARLQSQLFFEALKT